MSKRQSTGGNTLFNYFTVSPSVSRNDSPTTTKDRKDNLQDEGTPKKSKKQDKRQLDIDDEENVQPVKRRKRVIAYSDSESDENNSSQASTTADTPKHEPKKRGSIKNSPDVKLFPKKGNLQNGNHDDTGNGNLSQSIEDDDNTWLHNRLDFLKPNRIKDRNGKKPSDSEYDPRTLYVPPDFLSKQTPAMCQWWEMKSKYYDCILFFKVGKFYELYHMDAVIGVKELGFSYMKGEFAHSGFPESAYGRMLNTLVELGYRVARVEQTETPEAMTERLRGKPGKKVVKREICQITNKATRVQGSQDMEIKDALSTYLLAVCESRADDSVAGEKEFGVCFVDTSIGTFHLGQFKDDNRYSRLLTLLAEYPPSLILLERKQVSSEIKSVLKKSLGNIKLEFLNTDQFYTSNKTLSLLLERKYFQKTPLDDAKLPNVLQEMISKTDSLNTTCHADYDKTIRSLGACVWYLHDCLLDIQLLSMGRFELYQPSDICTDKSNVNLKNMVLDSFTLKNLNILGPDCTLQSTLDYCCTAFGKRMLHQWICRPICDISEITARQEAISELLNQPEVMQSARDLLSALPDLERLISKFHSIGNALRAKTHPDRRAIFYEEKSYSKRTITDFMATLKGFELAMSVSEIFDGVESKLLKKYTSIQGDGTFPDLRETIVFFKTAFNHEQAHNDGNIMPQKGVDVDYDVSLDLINKVKKESEEYLKSQEKYFGCKLTYTGNDKKRFQLEIPEHATRKVTREYSLEGTKKGSKPSKRYTTAETKRLLADLIDAENQNRAVLKDLNRRIFEKFSAKYDDWCRICYCLSTLDVLISLAEYAKNQVADICAPTILPFDSTPTLVVKNGVHPSIPNVENYVPNDAQLGTESHSPLLVLTGPNMGGKSTLMRQMALLAVMAQIGCHVPASSMTMTLVDRIFTRLGAHDDIMTGQSTFMIELLEASCILKHASQKSLVFLDELGRGTATYDGTAIATAYLDCLLRMQCRTIFSTHYYSLVDYYKDNTQIQLGHMACKVESDDGTVTESDDGTVTEETVIFMYKMVPGACPKSYGFNAARLAGIPLSVTSKGMHIAKRLETETTSRKIFRKIYSHGKNIRQLIQSLSI